MGSLSFFHASSSQLIASGVNFGVQQGSPFAVGCDGHFLDRRLFSGLSDRIRHAVDRQPERIPGEVRKQECSSGKTGGSPLRGAGV